MFVVWADTGAARLVPASVSAATTRATRMVRQGRGARVWSTCSLSSGGRADGTSGFFRYLGSASTVFRTMGRPHAGGAQARRRVEERHGRRGPRRSPGPSGCSACADGELLGLGGLEVGLVPRGGGVADADLVLALDQAG